MLSVCKQTVINSLFVLKNGAFHFNFLLCELSSCIKKCQSALCHPIQIMKKFAVTKLSVYK